MTRQIILKEDGTVAIFSSVIDDFLFDGISIDEWIEFSINERIHGLEDNIKNTYAVIKQGGNPYYQFKITYEEACNLRDKTEKGE